MICRKCNQACDNDLYGWVFPNEKLGLIHYKCCSLKEKEWFIHLLCHEDDIEESIETEEESFDWKKRPSLKERAKKVLDKK